MKNIFANKYIFVIVISIYLYGCKYFSEDKKGTIVLADKYTYDTTYYENGKIRTIGTQQNGIRCGWQYVYTANEALQTKSHFKDGLQDGLTYYYSTGGKLKEISRFLNGKPFGDQTHYYEGTENIKEYGCCDFQANCRYLEKYDTNKELKSRNGIAVCQLMYEGNLDSIFVNKSFIIHVCVAHPPFGSIKFYVYDFDFNENLLDKFEMNPVANQFTINNVFTKKGKTIQLIKCDIYTDKGTFVRTDSLKSVFEVK